jgi:hypothetical protein
MTQEQDNGFTIGKATELLQSFVGLMKDGCVSREVYDQRRSACEGCEFNQRRASDGAHFCGNCGCGARDLAKLYIEGTPIDEDHSPRLWMPKSNCPKDFHRTELGTGNFKPVGGRLKQLKNLTVATMAEAVGHSGAEDKLEYINRTADIIESVVVDDAEMEDLEKSLEEIIPKEPEQPAYNDSEGTKNEENTSNANQGQGFRGDANS